jgi:hypothetical protein
MRIVAGRPTTLDTGLLKMIDSAVILAILEMAFLPLRRGAKD